jgi:hypothetical protein
MRRAGKNENLYCGNHVIEATCPPSMRNRTRHLAIQADTNHTGSDNTIGGAATRV